MEEIKEKMKKDKQDNAIHSVNSYFGALRGKNLSFVEEDPYGLNTLWQVDEVCPAGKTDTDLCRQECAWAPKDIPAYFFTKAYCEQPGSFIYRYCVMYTYSLGCGWLVMTLVGVVVKIMARPETWFYNPHEANECFVWSWLRMLGP